MRRGLDLLVVGELPGVRLPLRRGQGDQADRVRASAKASRSSSGIRMVSGPGPSCMPVNATGAALLGLLRNGLQSGYALTQTPADTLGGFWTVTLSQVYRELAAMAADGLVQASSGVSKGRAGEWA